MIIKYIQKYKRSTFVFAPIFYELKLKLFGNVSQTVDELVSNVDRWDIKCLSDIM